MLKHAKMTSRDAATTRPGKKETTHIEFMRQAKVKPGQAKVKPRSSQATCAGCCSTSFLSIQNTKPRCCRQPSTASCHPPQHPALLDFPSKPQLLSSKLLPSAINRQWFHPHYFLVFPSSRLLLPDLRCQLPPIPSCLSCLTPSIITSPPEQQGYCSQLSAASYHP